jgi:hypothetical protein
MHRVPMNRDRKGADNPTYSKVLTSVTTPVTAEAAAVIGITTVLLENCSNFIFSPHQLARSLTVAVHKVAAY